MKKYSKMILSVLAFFTGLYILLDFVGGGAIRVWLSNNLFYESSYEYDGIVYHSTIPYWTKIYLFSFILAITISILFLVLLRYLVEKKTTASKNEVMKLMEKTLTAFRDGREYPELLDNYSSLDTLLIQIRNKEEKQIEMIEKQTRQKNDLISYLAHDIKTPLASVIGYLSLLHDVHDIPREQNDAYIKIALEKANRLEALIDEFFDVTRFNLHDIVISRGRIELRFLLEQLKEQFYPILIKEHKEILLDMPEQLIYYGDADKLARAFNNILKNAISYSYQNTNIRIETRQTESHLEFYFHNHGDEIPKQKLNLIFEKFYRLDKARSTNSGGAGLGLAIAKEIIHAHGGTIEAQSNMKETVFVVKLPVILE